MLAITIALATSGATLASGRPEISYFLPKVRVSASVAHRLARCPTDEDPTLRIEYTPALAAKATRGRLIVVDAGAGFLVDRSTKVGLESGMLRSFNSTATGQGGPVLVSLMKAAVTAYTLTAAPLATIPAMRGLAERRGAGRPRPVVPRPMVRVHVLRCNASTAATMAKLEDVENDIAKIERGLIENDSPALEALLERRSAQAEDLRSQLTLVTSTQKALDPKRSADGSVTDLTADLPPPELQRWLAVERRTVPAQNGLEDKPITPSLDEMLDRERETAKRPIVGRRGYTVSISVDPRMDRLLGCAPDAEPVPCSDAERSDTTVRGGRDLVHLRPVPATLSLAPIATDCAASPCPAGWGDEATAGVAAALPQLSRPQVVPTGGGSIFGRRMVAAEFDPLGEPTSIQYEKGGNATTAASIIDASSASSSLVADARLNALKRRVEIEKTKAELTKLLQAQLDEP